MLFAYNYNQERNEAFFNDIEEYAGRVFWLGSNNARHRATIAGSYDFPIGKGRKFGASMHPVLNGVFGGWQMSGIYTYRSGEFLRMPAAEVVGDPYIANPGPQMWFNADAFRVLPASLRRTNPFQYDGITGPIMWNVDATLSKVFPIRDRYKVEFRLEAYNATNSLMWANPILRSATLCSAGLLSRRKAIAVGRFSTHFGCSSDMERRFLRLRLVAADPKDVEWGLYRLEADSSTTGTSWKSSQALSPLPLFTCGSIIMMLNAFRIPPPIPAIGSGTWSTSFCSIGITIGRSRNRAWPAGSPLEGCHGPLVDVLRAGLSSRS